MSNLLADCEAAYTAREAFVTGGMRTFTTGVNGNDASAVVPNKDYGLIRTGPTTPRRTPLPT